MTKSTKTLLACAALAGLYAGGISTRVFAAEAGTKTAAPADKGQHSCKGQNSCKGEGGCKSGDNGCKGKNSCGGKGGCSTKTEKPAKDAAPEQPKK